MCIYLSEVKSILSRPHLQKLAVRCGFYKRKGSIDVSSFFDMLLHCANRTDHSSLSFMSFHLERSDGIVVSRTAIDKRFNENCLEFIRAVLGQILRERYSQWLGAYGERVFDKFNRVRIKDSTKFQIPDLMKEEFPGVGGCGGEAGISIQFEYDIKSGDILYMSINKGSANDHEEHSQACAKIEAGDLIIRDLGYFSREVFRAFMDGGAYFLSRLESQSIVVVDKGRKQLSFKDLYKEMVEKGITRKEITVLIGSQDQIKVRLIVNLVPSEVYQQRVRNAKKRNKVNNRAKHRKDGSKTPLQLKDETRARYRFTLLITNVESKHLPASCALPLYRMRWQVELVFKSWKGVYRIDRIGRMKRERFLCLLMAKLLLLAIQMQLTYRLQQNITDKATRTQRKKIQYIVLSPAKVAKTLRELFGEFYQMLRARISMTAYANQLNVIFSRNHTLDRRKNKLSFPEILALFVCKTRE